MRADGTDLSALTGKAKEGPRHRTERPPDCARRYWKKGL
jgi:hypothetical protein